MIAELTKRAQSILPTGRARNLGELLPSGGAWPHIAKRSKRVQIGVGTARILSASSKLPTQNMSRVEGQKIWSVSFFLNFSCLPPWTWVNAAPLRVTPAYLRKLSGQSHVAAADLCLPRRSLTKAGMCAFSSITSWRKRDVGCAAGAKRGQNDCNRQEIGDWRLTIFTFRSFRSSGFRVSCPRQPN